MDSFKDLLPEDYKSIDDLDAVFKDKLGISFAECAEALSESLKQRAEELVEDLPSMAPYGDYGELTEDPEVITKFLRDEAAKPENWKIYFIEVKKDKDQLIELTFHNKAVDDGDVLKGFVFIGLSGKIRHAFAQVHG
jgi:hypothetical protein